MAPVDELQSTILNLLAGRDVLNAQLAGNRGSRQARAYALQGLYLVAVRSFETFLEDQMLHLASNKIQWRSRRLTNGVRVKWSNRLRETRPEIVKTIILRDRDYVDYLPYERSVELAQILFKGGRPFISLEQQHKDLLVRCQRVRNYIAHESDFAYDKFFRSYSAIKPIRLRRPKPIHYLDDQIRAGVTLFEHDLTQLITIARFLS
jgi:hypothetical protein